jgi:thioredoxin reductase (NADPH)
LPTYRSETLIISTGASALYLGLPNETALYGRGVSACATCDGFFFKNKDLVVVGGGDSALQEALFLTKFATNVDVIHRRDELRASVALQSRAFEHEKISFTWDTVVEEIKANDKGAVNAIVTRNVKTNEFSQRPIDGVFILIGYDPNSNVFKGQLATDEAGYVLVDQLYRTNVEGVFAAGEIHDQIFRQAITAAGDGCAAALMTIDWLDGREDQLQPLDAEPLAEAGD